MPTNIELLGSTGLTVATSKVSFAGGCCAKAMLHQTNRKQIVDLISSNTIAVWDLPHSGLGGPKFSFARVTRRFTWCFARCETSSSRLQDRFSETLPGPTQVSRQTLP